eukprot:TRINITY_DN1103_c0_g1_i1.p1 TRINITY_DN1103_c0_g1~~TRINITY_DN1103_c0_g1_i1.p1  ORF type:complete len:145 (-),score=21.48 TRINITY_DN1103_c0_g1_i1:244-642(-)
MSGILPTDACIEAFNDLKMKKATEFVVYHIAESKVEVLEIAPTGTPFEEFVTKMPATDCRFAVYDYKYTNEAGATQSKILFIFWSPDTAKIKSKMIYASTKETFKRSLSGIYKELQACEVEDLTPEAMRALC